LEELKMENKNNFAYIAIVAIVAIVAVVVMMSGGSKTAVTPSFTDGDVVGKATIAPVQQIQPSCYDSDNSIYEYSATGHKVLIPGEDIYIKGNITTENSAGFLTDYCNSNMELYEGVCVGNGNGVASYICPLGCSNGVCLRPTDIAVERNINYSNSTR
jgi:hypothetical protein